ncbi:MAG: gliding motility-associated C-terminal domain-containing protein, partial [Bacteroidetes bacterium]|nr:gliding motility-associated C-terminal domain-containing protein [Bacteroidota bacterium]
RRYNNEQYIFEIWGGNNLNTLLQTSGPSPDSSATFSLPPGDYKAKLKLVACDLTYPTDYQGEADVEFLFSVYPKPVASIANEAPVTLCEEQSITLEGQASENGTVVTDLTGYSFVWSDVNGTILSGTQYQEVSEAGIYLLTVISPNGCPSDPATVEVLDARPDADLGEDITICVGEALPQQNVTASNVPANHSISWSRSVNFGAFNPLPLGSPATQQSLADINTDQAANYRYLIEVRSNDPAQSCFRIDTVAINVTPAPIVTLRAINNNCNGYAELLAEVSGGSGDFVFAFSNGVTNTTGRTGITESGTYSVTVTDAANSGGGCPTDSQEIEVNVDNGMQDLQLVVTPACRIPGAANLNEITAQTSYNGQVTYEWFNIINGQETRLEETTATILVPDGRYRVVATSDAGCNGAANTAEADVASIPNLVIPDYILCPENPDLNSVTVTIPTEYIVTGWFRHSEGVRRPIPGGHTVEIFEEGQYEVEVEGCAQAEMFNVSLSCTPELMLPNAINPNSLEFRNRVFSILNPHMAAYITDIEILIYNRWGEVIWQSNEKDFSWDGRKKNGQPVPMGNYPYLIRYRNLYGSDTAILRKLYGSIFVLD